MKDQRVVILCGGRGSRLSPLTESIPKPLAVVQGRPILWYTFLTLYKHGFRRFIFPLGYKGELIESFIRKEFEEYDCKIHFIDAGVDTSIAGRLKKSAKFIPAHADFFLLNGDTLFDFDISSMFGEHRETKALITLSSAGVVSNYGLIIEEAGRFVDFVRDSPVSSFSLGENPKKTGYVNAGFAWINRDALELIDLEKSENFEAELYSKVAKMGRAAHYRIKGDWFAIDTQKDLKIVNLEVPARQEVGKIMKDRKKDLSSRYTYQTRYFSDLNELKKNILNKSVIPHQVEIQPGPMKGS
ncbi:MAG TPA: NDP-sugar synthase, partial [bacterium]|nr:NDP-sugar synthase [bacterium]